MHSVLDNILCRADTVTGDLGWGQEHHDSLGRSVGADECSEKVASSTSHHLASTVASWSAIQLQVDLLWPDRVQCCQGDSLLSVCCSTLWR